jgi:hypothetical protein
MMIYFQCCGIAVDRGRSKALGFMQQISLLTFLLYVLLNPFVSTICTMLQVQNRSNSTLYGLGCRGWPG